jgi:hypothetical protein
MWLTTGLAEFLVLMARLVRLQLQSFSLPPLAAEVVVV